MSPSWVEKITMYLIWVTGQAQVMMVMRKLVNRLCSLLCGTVIRIWFLVCFWYWTVAS